MRVAIVHDFLTQCGGAERVVLALHRTFPDAPIYTSVFDPAGTFPELASADVRTSFLQRLPRSGRAFRAYLPAYPAVFGRLRLVGYDLVISSSSHFAHGVRTDGGLHVCYCHTPPRWLYQTGSYLAEGGPVPSWGRAAVRPFLAALRRWDRRAAARPHAYVANSQAVASRIRRIYGREARVVHPPVELRRFSTDGTGDAPPHGSFYLVVARLLPYKRVDLAVRVCAARRARLLVVGEGPAHRALERTAGPSVTFLGRVPEEELTRLYRACRALIQCGAEDFGIALLEANATGRPAVAYADGGALETVVDGETGVLFPAQTEAALHEALDRVEGRPWDAARLRRHASRFDESRFADELLSIVRTPVAVGAP